MRKLRLAEVISHPIQNRVPVYRQLAARPDVDYTVLFLTEHGVKPTFDPGFGKTFAYDIPLLDGYRYEFVPNLSRHPSPHGVTGAMNPALLNIFRRERLDAVQVHGWAQSSQWISFAACRATGAALMVSCDANLMSPPIAASKRLAKQVVIGQIARAADALLCVGIENRRYWESYGAKPEQLFDAPYSVDNDYFAGRAAAAKEKGFREQFRGRVGAGHNDIVLLNSSKLNEGRKRMSVLIEALRLLPKNVVAVFAGDGPDRAELEAHIKRAGVRASVLGFVNQSEIAAWYAAADALSISSEIEPWGLVVNEAMAAGLPVLSSDRVGAAADLVIPGQTGYVYPCGDAAALAGAVRHWIDDPPLLKRMSEGARTLIERYSPRRSAEGIVAAARAVTKRTES
jgi:glycosyltransferase involved in cell wall biosynthesis